MRRTFGLILTLGLSSGCANTAALETEMSRLRRELHFVRQDLAKQKRAVESLERRVTLVSLGKSPPPTSPTTTTPARRSIRAPVSIGPQPAPPPPPDQGAAPAPSTPSRRKTLPVVRLGSNAQPKPRRPQDDWDPGAQDDGGPPLSFRMGPDEDDSDDRLSVDRSVLQRPDPVLDANDPAAGAQSSPSAGSASSASAATRGRAGAAASSTPRARAGGRSSRKQVQAEYKAALARLREDKKPEEALRMFDAFLAAHPRSRYADNAAYWRGECLLAMSKHAEALAAFDLLIERHPRSPKVPFALVRKAVSYLATGKAQAAVQALRTVTEKYATSEAAETAKAMLDRQAAGQ